MWNVECALVTLTLPNEERDTALDCISRLDAVDGILDLK
jgi:hypothetical protein